MQIFPIVVESKISKNFIHIINPKPHAIDEISLILMSTCIQRSLYVKQISIALLL